MRRADLRNALVALSKSVALNRRRRRLPTA
jgi:hypothetical protein